MRQGKALYIGISSYSAEETQKAVRISKLLGTPILVHQPKYSMLDRSIENGLLDVLELEGVGCITFSSLAQGLLTNKYLNGIPADSRAATARGNGAIDASVITEDTLEKVRVLNEIAEHRRQSLAQMALAWVLQKPQITSVLIGASKPEQVLDSIKCLKNSSFANEHINAIEEVINR